MARYGLTVYGTDFYGAPNASLFSAAPFIANYTDYGEVTLSWAYPGGGWSELRLVRNFSGYPVAPENGVTLRSWPFAAGTVSYVDEGLDTDQWVYYSLFAYDDVAEEWVNSGTVSCFVAADYDALSTFTGRLPDVAQSADLTSFLSIIGFSYDQLRNAAYTLLDLYDSDRMSYDLIPVLMNQFGIPPEVALEPENYRRFLRNAVHFWKTKGSPECVHGVISSVTGWNSYLNTGVNLLWDAEHSDFVGGTGFWSRGEIGCNVSWVAPGVDAYDEIVPAAIRMTATTDGETIEASMVDIGNGLSDLYRLAIVVVPGMTYGFNGLVRGSDIFASLAALAVRWYDLAGNLLGTSTSDTVATRQFVDTEVTLLDAAPENAVWAEPVLLVETAAAGSYWEWRTLQFSQGDELQPHQPGRDLRITLLANRVNLVSNSSFETDVNGWTAQGNTTLVQDTTDASEGDASAKVTYTGSGLTGNGDTPLDGVLTYVPTIPGLRYGVQLTVGWNGDGQQVGFAAQVMDSAQTMTLEDADGTPASSYQIPDATSATLASGDAVLCSFAFIAQERLTPLIVSFTEAVTDATIHLDGVIVERSDAGTAQQWAVADPDVVQPYFDGASFSTTAEYFWEGTPYESPSHFYDRQIIHTSRLNDILPRYLPFGATYTLLFAQPGGTGYVNDDVIVVSNNPVPSTAPVSRDFALAWRNLYNASMVRQLLWNDIGQVNKDVELEWSTSALSSKDIELLWDTRAIVEEDFDVEWDVASPGPEMFSDDFSRADNSDLSGGTISYVYSGAVGIAGGLAVWESNAPGSGIEARAGFDAGAGIYIQDITTVWHIINGVGTSGSFDGLSLIADADGVDFSLGETGYVVRVTVGNFYVGNMTIYLYRDGSVVASTGAGYLGSGPVDYTVRLTNDGSGNINVYLDGSELISYADGSPLTGRFAGFSVGNGGNNAMTSINATA